MPQGNDKCPPTWKGTGHTERDMSEMYDGVGVRWSGQEDEARSQCLKVSCDCCIVKAAIHPLPDIQSIIGMN